MKKHKILLARILLPAFFILLFLAAICQQYGRQKTEQPLSLTSFKLNTVVRVTLYDSSDQEILERAMDICEEYEDIFSRTKESSELFRLNHQELPKDKEGFYSLSKPLAQVIEAGLTYAELSDGAFDITIAPVSSLWDFTSSENSLPEPEDIQAALSLVDYKNVSLSGSRLRFEKEGMQLDLGAAAKGYIADQIKEYLLSQGVTSALIDLGGNVLCVGSHPDGTPFETGIQKPFSDRGEQVLTLGVEDKSVVTSGVYERCFEKDGILYHHILNPRTGYPYDNGLLSVTIISDSSLDGDCLSTACFSLGLEKGMELVNSLPDIQAVFITEDGQLHLSDGFEESVTVVSKKS